MHAQPADFEGAVGQKILNKILQPFAAVAHVLQHFTLSLADRTQFLAMQELNISVQDGQWCLEIMGGGSECIGCALKTFAQFFVLVQQIFRTWKVLIRV